MKNKSTHGFVYLIFDNLNEAYKIGMTRGDVKRRLKQLQTGSSNELTIVDIFETDYPRLVEDILHRGFKPFQIHNEWFNLSFEDAQNFQEKCKETVKNIELLKEEDYFKKRLR